MTLDKLAECLCDQMEAMMTASHDEPEKFARVVEQTRAVSDISGKIIDTAKVALDAAKVSASIKSNKGIKLPHLLEYVDE